MNLEKLYKEKFENIDVTVKDGKVFYSGEHVGDFKFMDKGICYEPIAKLRFAKSDANWVDGRIVLSNTEIIEEKTRVML